MPPTTLNTLDCFGNEVVYFLYFGGNQKNALLNRDNVAFILLNFSIPDKVFHITAKKKRVAQTGL